MADDAQLLADAKKLPLGDQLGSSNWKVRAQALATVQERVGRAFSCEDEVFAEAGELRCPALLAPPPAAAANAAVPRCRQRLPLSLAWLAGPLLAKAVGDSNANVMDKAVEALVAYLEKADEALAARWVLPPHASRLATAGPAALRTAPS